MQTPTEPEAFEQARRLLEILADETLGLAVRHLLREPCTRKELQELLGVDQARLSRAVAALEDVGLLVHGPGRGQAQRLALVEETFAVLQAANALAEAINRRRAGLQRQASSQTKKDYWASPSDGAEKQPGS